MYWMVKFSSGESPPEFYLRYFWLVLSWIATSVDSPVLSFKIGSLQNLSEIMLDGGERALENASPL